MKNCVESLKPTEGDMTMFEGNDDSYKSAAHWRTLYPNFPDAYYDVLSLRSHGMTPKEFKNHLKRLKRREVRKKGGRTKRI